MLFLERLHFISSLLLFVTLFFLLLLGLWDVPPSTQTVP